MRGPRLSVQVDYLEGVTPPLRAVTYDLPGVPVPIRDCTRPTPEALAVAAALGYTLPARLPLTAAA